MTQTPTTMMTGATGFYGQFVLRELLRRGRRVVAMLRSPLTDSTRRLAESLRELGVELDGHIAGGRLLLVAGSLPDDLPQPTWGATDDILTSAASLQLFSNGNDEPFNTNVAGTRALIDWARTHGVERIHAVSTAYVCGQNADRIREEFHDPPPGFQTDYERSKWMAERELYRWAAEDGHVLTVLRPSFLVGDSRTGYTTQFVGFYRFARMVSMLKDRYGNGEARTYVPLKIPGHPDEPIQNLVPVDFAARLAAEIVIDPRHHGRIYHLTDPQPPTKDFLKSCLEDYFRMYGGYFVGDNDGLGSTPAESLLWKQDDFLVPRLGHHPQFDRTNTAAAERQTGVAFPPMNRETMFRLLDFATARRWGQRTNGNRR